MSNLLWAYGQLREEMDEELLERLAQRLIANRKELRPITIPLTLMVRSCPPYPAHLLARQPAFPRECCTAESAGSQLVIFVGSNLNPKSLTLNHIKP